MNNIIASTFWNNCGKLFFVCKPYQMAARSMVQKQSGQTNKFFAVFVVQALVKSKALVLEHYKKIELGLESLHIKMAHEQKISEMSSLSSEILPHQQFFSFIVFRLLLSIIQQTWLQQWLCYFSLQIMLCYMQRLTLLNLPYYLYYFLCHVSRTHYKHELYIMTTQKTCQPFKVWSNTQVVLYK